MLLLASLDAVAQLRHSMRHGGPEGICLGIEMDIEGAGGHARFLRQSVDAQSAEAAAAKTAHRGLHDALTGLMLLLFSIHRLRQAGIQAT